ncbi:MAG: adenylate/guanylate cyclase domain-containing protein [Bacteroidota bacterium]
MTAKFMNSSQYVLNQWLYYCGWINLFALIRFVGWDNINDVMLSGGVSLPQFLIIGNAGALIAGTGTGLFELHKYKLFPEGSSRKKLSVTRALIFIAIVFASALLSSFAYFLIADEWKIDVLIPHLSIIYTSSPFKIILLFLAVVSCINIILLSFMDWHGSANFSSIISGKINISKEENRVFLFVDLNSSTKIALKIGTEKYAQLIDFCFDHLRKLSKQYKAEIYQYVGDEMVLSWSSFEAFKSLDGWKLFLDFKSSLHKHEEELHLTYGLVPSFKAALSEGLVYSTIIGTEQKHKAYYGQPLNRASRMLEKCKVFQVDFLTDIPPSKAAHQRDFHFKYISSARLRGDKTIRRLYNIIMDNFEVVKYSEIEV